MNPCLKGNVIRTTLLSLLMTKDEPSRSKSSRNSSRRSLLISSKNNGVAMRKMCSKVVKSRPSLFELFQVTRACSGKRREKPKMISRGCCLPQKTKAPAYDDFARWCNETPSVFVNRLFGRDRSPDLAILAKNPLADFNYIILTRRTELSQSV